MIYLSGPMSTTAERTWNSVLADNLRSHGYCVLLPQEFPSSLRLTNIRASHIFVMNCSGADTISSVEFGYAKALNRRTILYRTDQKDDGLIADLADAFINRPLGTYSEIGRSIIGHIKRLNQEIGDFEYDVL